MADYNMSNPQNAAEFRAFHRAVRQRLLADPGWVNWNRMNMKKRQDYLQTYRLGRYHNRFIETGANPFLDPPVKKALQNIGMPCTKCNELGKHCTGVAPKICPQCAVAGFKQADCVYFNDALKLSVPAWYGQVAAGGGAPIQPAVPNRAGAGLAIRLPSGKGSPTGFMEQEAANNNLNSNASRDPNADEEAKAAGKEKKNKRRATVAKLLANSALTNNDNLAAGNESAVAVQAMAKAAGGGGGGGGGGKKSRKRKNRKQKLTRKQK
jgi:hypothetical protein